ncbi:AP-1 complex subunit sigma-2 isoform X2 [Myripristis murdjan]|uniref:AP-1 complex subunit sigma-2 isoform X2 n=1 Tax=Myripristis murdjan TaxID=586833 RepID=UPI0011761581|nr:AP-1 complex subunit sigma-2 isoform X2 [Myripristis murdjan]
MQFMLLFSRQGKLRLQKWYVPLSDKEKKKITRELVQTVLARKPKMCSFLEWRDLKIVYKRYASLYFCCAIEDQDNELITLEIIHRYVELLDKYFGSVCELDIIFNFEKAYFILDEFLLGGEAQETSKKNVLKAIEQADLLQENIDFQMRLFAGNFGGKPNNPCCSIRSVALDVNSPPQGQQKQHPSNINTDFEVTGLLFSLISQPSCLK